MMTRHGCAASASSAIILRRTNALRRHRLQLVTAMVCAVLMLGLGQPLRAQTHSAGLVPTYTGTLKKIAETGAVQIGYRENSPPFAFLDANRKPIGYSLDLCEIVVE